MAILTSKRKNGTLAKQDSKTGKLAGTVQTKGKKTPTSAKTPTSVVKTRKKTAPAEAPVKKVAKAKAPSVQATKDPIVITPAPLSKEALIVEGFDLDGLARRAKYVVDNRDDLMRGDDEILQDVLVILHRKRLPYPLMVHLNDHLAMADKEKLKEYAQLRAVGAKRKKMSKEKYAEYLGLRAEELSKRVIEELEKRGVPLKDIALIAWREGMANEWYIQKSRGDDEVSLSRPEPTLIFYVTKYITKEKNASRFGIEAPTDSYEYIVDEKLSSTLPAIRRDGWELIDN